MMMDGWMKKWVGGGEVHNDDGWMDGWVGRWMDEEVGRRR